MELCLLYVRVGEREGRSVCTLHLNHTPDYAQCAGEFVMQNNNVPPFHLYLIFINFLVCKSLQLLSFPGAVHKLLKVAVGGADWGTV